MLAGPVVVMLPMALAELHPSYDAFGTSTTSCSLVEKLNAENSSRNYCYIYISSHYLIE